MTRLKRLGLIGPLVTVAAGVVVFSLLGVGGSTSLVVDEEGFGPTSWPKVMLIGIIASGFVWGVVRWAAAKQPADDRTGPYVNNVKLFWGMAAVVLYGAGLVYIGFAFATFLFLLSWFVLGGMRDPLLIVGNATLGTLALLYLFLKVAYLPLPRGMGYMDTLTVGLYQVLQIF